MEYIENDLVDWEVVMENSEDWKVLLLMGILYWFAIEKIIEFKHFEMLKFLFKFITSLTKLNTF